MSQNYFQTLIPLSLVDEEVSSEEIKYICNALWKNMTFHSSSFNYEKSRIDGIIDKEDGVKPILSKLINEESTIIFKIISHQTQNVKWVQLPIETWQLMNGFTSFK